MPIVLLPDGFTGAVCSFDTQPLESDRDLVKLHCSEPGKEHLITWVHVVDLARAPRIHYETAPVRFRQHEWRMIVKDDQRVGGRCTQYQFRRPLAPNWTPETEWPSYNSHDGTYAGCPKSLVTKVYYPNQRAIEAAVRAPTQAGGNPPC